jgi:hypothetical protein
MANDRCEFLIQGSQAEPYCAIFWRDGSELRASGTCAGALEGISCKHRMGLLTGDVSAVVQGAERAGDIAEWVRGSALNGYLAALGHTQRFQKSHLEGATMSGKIDPLVRDFYSVRLEQPAQIEARLIPESQTPVRLVVSLRDHASLFRSFARPPEGTILNLDMDREAALEVLSALKNLAHAQGWQLPPRPAVPDGMQRQVSDMRRPRR